MKRRQKQHIPASVEQFLPMTSEQMAARGWDELDILLISGDAYVDHPSFGTALIGRLLESKGYRVGIIAQPDWKSPDAFKVMGRPRLFCAISAGSMDSMVNHYTAAKKIRRDDAYTPGGKAGARPNRAVIAYTAAVKGAFKGLPIIIGGIEASLRRLAHYDYWSDSVRRSVLVDSKADLLIYGMAESAILNLAEQLNQGTAISELKAVRGTATIETEAPSEAVILPSFEEVVDDTGEYNSAFKLAAQEINPLNAKVLAQQHAKRFVVEQPPALPLSESEIDQIYALPFTRLPHPSYKEKIPAWDQIKFSITSHRGCFGGCAFCAITHHQGKTIQSRSQQSVQAEVERMTHHPDFRGTITDVGGPTANMYKLRCCNPAAEERCRRGSCLYPSICKNLNTSDREGVRLLRELEKHPKVKHLFVASGIRYDLLEEQPGYFADLVDKHVGGLLKVAPESTVTSVTRVMRKPGPEQFSRFLNSFRHKCDELGKRYGVVPYFISAHPGCTVNDMVDVALFLKRHRLRVEQVQEFTPTPGSLSTCIYHTGRDPFTDERVHIPRNDKERRMQKALLLWHLPEQRKDVMAALEKCGREDVADELYGRSVPSVEKRPRGGKPGNKERGDRRPRRKKGR